MVTPSPIYSNVSLAVVYDSVIFPFELLPFLRLLSKQGYLLPEPVAAEILALPRAARVEAGSLVARKGDTLVAINSDRKTMAVHAALPETAVDEMESLEELVKKQMGIDATEFARFYEFTSGFALEATTDPLQRWAVSLEQVPMIRRIPEILGMPIAPFGLRFVGAGQLPTKSEWLDIRIEPRVHAPTTHHFVDVLFRHSERIRVLEFARNLERTMRELVDLLEEE
jgi:hypothetical protein